MRNVAQTAYDGVLDPFVHWVRRRPCGFMDSKIA